MKYRIYFTINNIEDYFDIEARTIFLIRQLTLKEMGKRGLDQDINEMWSEEIIKGDF